MSRQHEIRIKVNETEFENIKHNAEIMGMQIAPYLRMVAENPNIIKFDYSAIQAHTRQVGQIVNSINMLIFTIELQNNYQPKEIDGIVNYIKEIWETENKLLDIWRKHMIATYKQGRSVK